MTTVADVLAQVRDGRLEDFRARAVVLVARELIEGEISAEIGAELGEVASEARSTHRNGYRERAWETSHGWLPRFIETRTPLACGSCGASSSSKPTDSKRSRPRPNPLAEPQQRAARGPGVTR